MAVTCKDYIDCLNIQNFTRFTIEFQNESLFLDKPAPEASGVERNIKACLIMVISCLIIFSNILNILVIQKTLQLPRITRICILNMSVSDLLVGLLSCFPCIIPAFTGSWPYGEIWCQFAGIIHGTSVTISIWSLSLISIDRYFAIVRPLKSRCLLTPSKVVTTITVLWIIALITFFSPLPTKHNFIYYKYSVDEMICGLYWEYRWFCVITALYIPIISACVIIFTNFKVTRKVVESRRMVAIWRTGRCSGQNEMRAVKLLTVATVVYFVSWGPYVIQVIIMSLANINNIPSNVRFATMWLANCNSFSNVMIYSAMYKSFRRRATYLIRSLCFFLKDDGFHMASTSDKVFYKTSSSKDPAEMFD